MEVQTTHQPGVMPKEFPMENFNQSVIKHKIGQAKTSKRRKLSDQVWTTTGKGMPFFITIVT